MRFSAFSTRETGIGQSRAWQRPSSRDIRLYVIFFMGRRSREWGERGGRGGEGGEEGGGGGAKAKGAGARGVEVFHLFPSVTRLISWVLLRRGLLRVSYGRHLFALMCSPVIFARLRTCAYVRVLSKVFIHISVCVRKYAYVLA